MVRRLSRSIYLSTFLTGFFSLTSAQADEGTPDESASTEMVEFSDAFLMGDAGSQLDLKRFSRGNPVLAGTYNVKVFLNGKEMFKTPLTFHENNTEYASACFTHALLEQLSVDPEPLNQEDEDGCYDLAATLPKSSSRYDPLTQELNVTIPQVYLVSHPAGYIPPSRWDSGIPMALLSYNANAWHSKSDNTTQDTFYSGLMLGLNLGAWRLRSNGAYNWDNDNGGEYSSYDLFIARDIVPLRAKLEAGDVRTNANMMDSVSLDGVHLYNDAQMDPSANSYVPVIRGVANSNAKVTVRQEGRIVTQITVPPGPFAISDYYAAQNGSDLDVTVEESDGSTRVFSMPYASIAHLLRPGEVDWDIGIGTVDKDTVDETLWAGVATASYGLSNMFTAYGGVQMADNLYTAGMLGVAMNTSIGAFSFDVTHSQTTADDVGTLKGQSYSLNYSKNFTATGTTFSVVGYRFSSENYMSMNDALSLKNTLNNYASDKNTTTQEAYHAYTRTRNEIQANVYQDVTINGESYGSFYLNGTWRSYWGDDGNTSQYSVGYSNSVGSVSYSISAQRSYDEFGEEDDSINLGFSIPLGSGSSVDYRPFSSMSVNSSSDFKGNDSVSAMATGSSRDNMYNYSLNTMSSRNKDSEDLTTIGSWVTRNGAYSTTSLSATQGLNGDQQYSLSTTGGVVLHSGGLTLASGYLTPDSTMALVHASGAKGASASMGNGQIDGFGNMVVTSLSPYRENTVGLNIDTMENDVAISNTTGVVVPTSGALVRVDIETDARKAFMLELMRDDGGFIPLAADVQDSAGSSVGTVGQAGIAFVRGMDDSGTLSVIWGSGAESRCQVSYQLDGNASMIGKTPLISGLRCRMSSTSVKVTP